MEKLINFMNKIMGRFYIPCVIPADKQAHALSGMFLFLSVWLLAGIIPALMTVYAAAISKEIYDHFHPATHTCDVMDFVATVLLPTIVFSVSAVL